MTLPVADDLSDVAAVRPDPCTLVIFGGSGDLSRRKLLPGLYNLAVDGVLPEPFAVIGCGRRQLDDDSFRAMARESVNKFSRRSVDEDVWRPFGGSLFFRWIFSTDRRSRGSRRRHMSGCSSTS